MRSKRTISRICAAIATAFFAIAGGALATDGWEIDSNSVAGWEIDGGTDGWEIDGTPDDNQWH